MNENIQKAHSVVVKSWIAGQLYSYLGIHTLSSLCIMAPDANEAKAQDKASEEAAHREACDYWGYLIKADKCGTELFNRLLEGIADVVVSATALPTRIDLYRLADYTRPVKNRPKPSTQLRDVLISPPHNWRLFTAVWAATTMFSLSKHRPPRYPSSIALLVPFIPCNRHPTMMATRLQAFLL